MRVTGNHMQPTVSTHLMQQILNDPQYKGKHVIVVADKIFTANTGEGARAILKEIDGKYPNVVPEIAYIPDADTLILIVW